MVLVEFVSSFDGNVASLYDLFITAGLAETSMITSRSVQICTII